MQDSRGDHVTTSPTADHAHHIRNRTVNTGPVQVTRISISALRLKILCAQFSSKVYEVGDHRR